MIKIAERINATRKDIGVALLNKDVKFLQNEAIMQEKCGADYIDINCGSGEDEEKTMQWLVEAVQDVTNLPLCIDSSSPSVILSGLKKCKNPHLAIANSLTYEKDRIEKLLPIVVEHNCGLICLLMDENGIPHTQEKRIEIAERFVQLLEKNKISTDKVFFDPLVEPISLDTKKGLLVLGTIAKLKEKLPQIKIVVSLSGISFGLPSRRLLNRSFIPPLIFLGCNAMILDVCDKEVISTIYASEALFDKDEFCMNYIQHIRESKI